MRRAIKNGALIDEKDAVLPVTSRAVQYSFSVYEALRIIKGSIVHFHDHYMRLEYSASQIGLKLNVKEEELLSWIKLLIDSDRIVEATMRILVVGGDLDTVFITYQDLLSYPDSYYQEGIKCYLYQGERFLPEAKTSNLLMSYIARESAPKDCFETLLVNRNGKITEGTRSNFYAIKGNCLYTAEDSLVLGGITREYVIKAAEKLGLEVVYSAPSSSDADSWDGAFISSTSMAAMPVSYINGNKISFKSHDMIIRIRDIVREWELQ